MAPAPRRLLVSLLALIAPAAAGCGGGDRAPAEPPAAAHQSSGAPIACRPLHGRVTGRVDDPSAAELSGLVRSPSRPDVLWSHGDSGAGPTLLALRADGRVLAHVTVTGAEATDWEDIAAGRGPGGEPVLYVADIGDNTGSRPTVDVYRVPEPGLDDGAASAPAERLRLRYPDGPHDAEALLVDPRGGDLVIVTKTLGSGRAYRTSTGLPAGSEATLEAGPRIDLPLITGGSVSADGRAVVLRSYTGLLTWQRRAGESIAAALRRPPCRSPTLLLEGQGEAVALDATGASLATVTEGTGAEVRRYAPAGR